MLFRKSEKIKVEQLLYQSLQIGIGGAYAYEFPPNIARKIYKGFHLNTESKILDPCAGWGGRMLGASVVSNSYTCFEPSKETYKGLILLLKFINRMNKSFCSSINNIPFEESELKKDFYDFALTSPPYYNTELYSDEENNSCNRYKTFESWVDGFFCPLIEKTMQAIKPHSTFVLNIGDRKYPLSSALINNFNKKYDIERMTDFLAGNSGGLGKREGKGEAFYSIKK